MTKCVVQRVRDDKPLVGWTEHEENGFSAPLYHSCSWTTFWYLNSNRLVLAIYVALVLVARSIAQPSHS